MAVSEGAEKIDKSIKELNRNVNALKHEMVTLKVEFKWFKGIIITVYGTVIAPLVIAAIPFILEHT